MASRYISPALRRLVHKRARNCCEYCYSQLGYSPDPFNVEHIHPRSKGGPTSPDNLALACFGCNNAKGIKTIATGRATIALLALNRPGLRQLRQILYRANEHPPAPISRG